MMLMMLMMLMMTCFIWTYMHAHGDPKYGTHLNTAVDERMVMAANGVIVVWGGFIPWLPGLGGVLKTLGEPEQGRCLRLFSADQVAHRAELIYIFMIIGDPFMRRACLRSKMHYTRRVLRTMTFPTFEGRTSQCGRFESNETHLRRPVHFLSRNMLSLFPGVRKAQLVSAKHAIARPLWGRAMACFAGFINSVLSTPPLSGE